MLDWNWLYSAIAQSSAALVAFFGGFIATKIISNQAAHSEMEREMDLCVTNCNKLAQRASAARFKTVIEDDHWRADNRVKNLIRESRGEKSAEQYYLQSFYSSYEPHEPILETITGYIAKAKREVEEQEIWQEGRQMKGVHSLGGDAGVARQLHNAAIQDAKIEIRDLIVDINHESQYASLLFSRASVNPHSSRLLGYSALCVLLIFFLGVIYPLSFLPADGNIEIYNLSLTAFFGIISSLKGMLLSSISITFASIVVVLWITNSRLRVRSDLKEALKYYSDPQNYSMYFQIARKSDELKAQFNNNPA